MPSQRRTTDAVRCSALSTVSADAIVLCTAPAPCQRPSTPPQHQVLPGGHHARKAADPELHSLRVRDPGSGGAVDVRALLRCGPAGAGWAGGRILREGGRVAGWRSGRLGRRSGRQGLPAPGATLGPAAGALQLRGTGDPWVCMSWHFYLVPMTSACTRTRRLRRQGLPGVGASRCASLTLPGAGANQEVAAVQAVGGAAGGARPATARRMHAHEPGVAVGRIGEGWAPIRLARRGAAAWPSVMARPRSDVVSGPDRCVLEPPPALSCTP